MSDAARSSGVGVLGSAARTPWFLTTPPEPKNTTPRPGVTAQLDAAVRAHPVLVIGAPSGFGKSTAVAEWAAHAGHPVAWLSLTRFDGDGVRVAQGVAAALRRAYGDEEGLASVSFPPSDLAGAVSSIAELIEDRDDDTVLVVDQAEFAEDLPGSLIGELALKQPRGLRLLIVGTAPASDTVRALGVPRDCATMGPESLAFDAREVAAAGRLIGVDIDDKTAADIRDRTGGWPVAVRGELEGTTADLRLPLDDYIEAAVLAALPDPLAEVVRATVILSAFDVGTAVAVSGRADAGALLEECVRRGVFLDRFSHDGRRVYVWHQAFATAVAGTELRRDTAATRARHSRAAEALRAIDPLAAVAHHLAAGESGAAYGLLLDAWLEMLHQGRAVALDRGCAALPPPYDTRAATLGIRAYCAWVTGDSAGAKILRARGADAADLTPAERVVLDIAALLTTDDPDALRARIESIDVALRRPGVISARTAPHVLFILGYAGLRLRRSPIDTIATLRTAAREARAQGSPRLAGRIAGTLSFALAFDGHFTDALAEADRSTEVDRETEWQIFDGGGPACTVGFVAYWRDDLALARAAFQQVREAAPVAMAFSPLAIVYDALAAAASGDRAWQGEAMERLRRMPSDTILGVPWRGFRDCALAEIAFAGGYEDEAVRYATRTAELTEFLPVPRAMAAEILRRSRRPDEARALIARTAAASLTVPGRIRLQVTDALLRADAGRADAHIALENALDLAEPEGVLRPFSDPFPELRSLLEAHARWGTRHGAFIAQALARKEAMGSTTDLSAREREILAYLRTPMTIAEIAGALFLSVNTVKTHVQSIYRKLGVRNRREAVQSRL